MSLMKISELFNFEKGSLQSSKCTSGNFDFITASSEWKTHNEYTHDCEALIFAAAASGSLGRTHYVKGKFISSDLCFIITPKDPLNLPIDLKFYHMIFNEFKNDMVKSTKAGTSKEAIGLKAFGNYQLPYFEIKKQIEAKTQFVNMQFSKIELNVELEYQLDLIKQLRQAFLREAMQGKLVKSTNTKETGQQLLEKIKAEKAQLIADKKLKKEKELPPIGDNEIPFEIPEHWAWCRFEDICDIESNLVNPDKFLKLPHIAPNHIEKNTGKLLAYGTVEEDELISAKHYFFPGQLLYSKVRPKLNKVVKVDFEGLCSADMYPLRAKINTDFLLKCMLSQYFLDEVDKFDNRVKMPKLNQKQLANLPVPLPSLQEQAQIVSKLNKIFVFCESLERNVKESIINNEQLLQQVLREALQPKEAAVIDSLFENKNYDLYIAMMQKLIENQLHINYGEVATQKTVFHLNTFTDEKISYSFMNSNYGTYSFQLKDDLTKNPYLSKSKIGNGEVFVVKPNKEKEVKDALAKPENKSFVDAVKKVLTIYENPVINKETEKVELLNTISKMMIDFQTSDLEIVYEGMRNWEIKQKGFKNKAEKFSKAQTKSMISLIEKLGLITNLIN